MVDALALGASGAIHGGSSPLLGTTKTRKGFLLYPRGLEHEKGSGKTVVFPVVEADEVVGTASF